MVSGKMFVDLASEYCKAINSSWAETKRWGRGRRWLVLWVVGCQLVLQVEVVCSDSQKFERRYQHKTVKGFDNFLGYYKHI